MFVAHAVRLPSWWLTKELALEGYRENDKKSCKLPSGKDFRVIGKIIDNNDYLVLGVKEICF